MVATKLPRLNELTDAYARLVDLEDEDFAQAIEDLSDAITVKSGQVAHVIHLLKTEAEMLAAEEHRLRERREAVENRRDWLRRYLCATLTDAGMKGWKDPFYTITVMPGRKRLEVQNVSMLPDGYVLLVPQPQKDAIKAALEAGEAVPGAALIDGDPYLVIR